MKKVGAIANGTLFPAARLIQFLIQSRKKTDRWVRFVLNSEGFGRGIFT